MREEIKIDGSYGEGGGQLLRTSLSLAALCQRPLHIFNIRAKRPKPGLRPQHLSCVKAIQKIAKAEVEGGVIGAKKLTFIPNGIYSGHYEFDIGTAGAISLVVQTIILPLTLALHPSSLRIRGGTHVPWSPPFHYLDYVFAPMLAHLGIEIKLKLKQWGFYPKGGGEVGVKIYPTKTLKGKKWLTPPSFSHLKTISSSLGLAQHIKKRQTRTLLDFLNKLGLKSDVLEIEAIGRGQGSFLFLWVNEEIKAGFSALGAKGKPAEQVAKEVFNDFLSYYKTKPCLENHLADQIVPYLALAEEKSQFSTIISSHLLTNIWVINKFLNGKITYKGQLGHLGRVCIN